MSKFKSIVIGAALVAGLALVAEDASANPDTVTVNASISSSLTLDITGTIEGGAINGLGSNGSNFGVGSASDTPATATITSFGFDNAAISIPAATVLTLGTDTFNVDVTAYNDTLRTTAITTIALDSTDGITEFYLFGNNISNVDANDGAGNYTGTETVTLTGS